MKPSNDSQDNVPRVISRWSMFIKKPITLVIIMIVGILIAILSACTSNTPPASLTPITVQLKWLHQSQFAGFYAADQNGYYADENLAVTFIEGGSEVDLYSSVLDGTVQFGIGDAAQLILERADGKPLQAIGVIYRRSPLVFISLAEKDIIKPKDIIGKTVRITPDVSAVFNTIMANSGITSDQYSEVNVPSDLEIFASGEPAVWGVYLTGFALTIQQAGYDINLIFPDNYGVHFYTDTIFSSDDLIANDPDLVTRFLRASLKGWTYAVENPSEIGAMVVKYNPDADPEIENEKMIASVPLVNTGEDHIGWMNAEIWSGMEKTMREQGVLSQPLDVTQVYDMQFVEEIYK